MASCIGGVLGTEAGATTDVRQASRSRDGRITGPLQSTATRTVCHELQQIQTVVTFHIYLIQPLAAT